MPRSTRSLIAIILWIAAGFIAVNNLIASRPLNEWLLPLVLLLVGLGLWFMPDRAAAEAETEAAEAEYSVTEKRMDALAASASHGDPHLQDPVENMSVMPSTLEETGEVSGPPGAPARQIPLEPDPVPASTQTAPTPAPAAPASAPVSEPVMAASVPPDTPPVEPEPALEQEDRANAAEPMTEERSDAIAAAAEPSEEEEAAGVENINEEEATLEESGELAGPPGEAVGREEVVEEDEVPASQASTTGAAEVVEEDEPSSRVSTIGAAEAAPETAVEEFDTPDVRTDVGFEEDVEEKRQEVQYINTDAPPPPATHEPITPTEAVPDDLKVIEGIGPRMEAALVAAGVDNFAKLAQVSEDEIRAAIHAAGMRFAPSVPTWAQQAAFAARGDWAGLKAYQETLRSGRPGGRSG